MGLNNTETRLFESPAPTINQSWAKVSVPTKYPDTLSFAVSKPVSRYIFITFQSIRIIIQTHLEYPYPSLLSANVAS